MNWESLLAEFRALGGIADNVTLRLGVRGRGVFAADPARPVRLFAPPNLLVPCEDTEIRSGQLVVKASSSVGERERAFFGRYQRNFSWGAGVFEDLWQTQLAWNLLPQNARDALLATWPMRSNDFSQPSEDACHSRYLDTRMIKYREVPVLMPVVELINHGRDASAFDRTNGIGVGGMFSDEVLATYGSNDCWGTAVSYGFCEARNYAYATQGSFKFEGYLIKISRSPNRAENYNGVALPIVHVEDGAIHFSFLTLGNEKCPDVPRAAFLHATKNIPIEQPDKLFDLIQHHNRHLLIKFLRGSEGSATSLVAMLRRAAYQQLETLSCHWGARTLSAEPEDAGGTGPNRYATLLNGI
ncbi:MAG: hypothetical protein ABI608_00160 [Rhizomicrobium sp.]